MAAVELAWQSARPLRKAVLGWPSEPVPGDLDRDTRHLGQRDKDGAMAGVVSFTPHTCPDRPAERAVYLYGMAVRPDQQRRGVGTSLLQEVLAWADASGAAPVWADARQTAVPFYERLGGVVEGESYPDAVSGLNDRRVIFYLRK